MRVIIISEGLDLPEFHMLCELSKRGIEVTVMLPSSDDYSSPLATAGLRVVPLELKGRLDLAGIRAIRAELKVGKYDILHTLRNNRPLSNALWASIGIVIKKVAYRGTMGNLSRIDPASWLAYLSPRLDRLISVSNAVGDYLKTMGVPASRVQTIYKGHDVDWYAIDKRPTLRSFGIPEGAFVVGCVANMRPLKGVHVVVEAAGLLPATSNIHFLFIGEVRDRELMEQAAQKEIAGRVHFAGYRSDARELISACQVSVMASLRREGLPRAIIESMAQSVVPVVTNVGGMPELVEDGVSGLVVPVSDAPALADAFTRLETDTVLHESFRVAARERIKSVFSLERTVEATLALYESLSTEVSSSLSP